MSDCGIWNLPTRGGLLHSAGVVTGNKIGTYRCSFAGIGWTIYVGVMLLLGGAANLFGVGGGKASPLSERLGLAAICLVIGLLVLLPAVMRHKQVVEVFERGLVWYRLLGTRTINAANVKSVKHILHTGRNGNYDEVELVLTDGKSYSINGIKEAAQFVAYLRAWSSAPAGAPFVAAVAPGQAAGWAPPPVSGGWRPPGN
ncbi:MAG: hypothetical protein ABIQ16_07095 [Polyangiaceae bacterium]